MRHRLTAPVKLLVGLGVLVAALAAPSGAGAGARFQVPAEDPGPPFYVRGLNDDAWAAVFFVRDPGCVPGELNLLGPPDVPAVFGCPLRLEGSVTYENGPADLIPRMAILDESAPLTVWFMTATDLAAAAADGTITKAELQARPSLLVGTATRYREVIHPLPAANTEVLVTNSTGTLSDGRRFRVHASLNQRQSSQFPAQLCGCPLTGPVTIEFG